MGNKGIETHTINTKAKDSRIPLKSVAYDLSLEV